MNDLRTIANPPTTRPAFYTINGKAIAELLEAHCKDVFDTVQYAYGLHAKGQSVNPDSYFLRFEDKPLARIIALPAYVGGTIDLAGIKWISSFPENKKLGLLRASGILILNDYSTGYPVACMEAGAISATRTACLAARAAEALSSSLCGSLAVIGTGRIARTTLSWLLQRGWSFESIKLFDQDRTAAQHCADWIAQTIGCSAQVTDDANQAMEGAALVILATTVAKPYLNDEGAFASNPTILHLSLRDISTERILAAQNIVDDVEHCMKAHTSVHLAELQIGTRSFVSGTLQDVIEGNIEPDLSRPRIFSPFGLGVLDVALGALVFNMALSNKTAVELLDFFDI